MTGLMVRTSASQDSLEIGSIGGIVRLPITKDHQTAAVMVGFSWMWRTVTACYARTRFARGTYCYWIGGGFEQWRTCTVFGDIIRLSAGE